MSMGPLTQDNNLKLFLLPIWNQYAVTVDFNCTQHILSSMLSILILAITISTVVNDIYLHFFPHYTGRMEGLLHNCFFICLFTFEKKRKRIFWNFFLSSGMFLWEKNFSKSCTKNVPSVSLILRQSSTFAIVLPYTYIINSLNE